MRADFTQTNWSVVHQASVSSCSAGQNALESLCKVYWPAIYTYLRCSNHSPSDAEDLTQGFFAQLLHDGSISNADPQKGRFRSFLLGALRHFLADERRYRMRQRRGGGKELVPLDGRVAERVYVELVTPELPPDKAYDRAWALAILEQAMARISGEQAQAGKREIFDALSTFLNGDPQKGEYLQVAERFRSRPETIAVTVHRLRKRFREIVREEAAKTLANPAELEDELRELAALFS